MLKETFIDLFKSFTDNPALVSELWEEIEINYSNPKRHYHTLDHLSSLLKLLTQVKEEISNWKTTLLKLYYHDIVYNPLKADNEEKSADLFEKRMRQLSVSSKTIEHCKQQIVATKSHITSLDSDTNYFLDADLSVLGQPWEIYLLYSQNVRKEYAIYPDFVYNPGRKKVLTHFLEMDRIFKTNLFYDELELQAQKNLNQELKLL